MLLQHWYDQEILRLCTQLLLSHVSEPEPTNKTEEKPKAPVKKNEPQRNSPVSSSYSHFMFFFFFFFFYHSLTPSIQRIIAWVDFEEFGRGWGRLECSFWVLSQTGPLFFAKCFILHELFFLCFVWSQSNVVFSDGWLAIWASFQSHASWAKRNDPSRWQQEDGKICQVHYITSSRKMLGVPFQ